MMVICVPIWNMDSSGCNISGIYLRRFRKGEVVGDGNRARRFANE